MKEQVLSNRELSQICRSVSLLLHAGINVADGLYLLAEEEEGELKALLERMGRLADEGSSLAQVMEESGCFPVYVTGLAKVGEFSGHLEEALLALAQYYDEQERMVYQIRSALLYPSVLLFMMLIIIGVLLVRVLPVFDEVYISLGGGLTGLAGGLLKAGRVLEAAMPVLGVCLAVVAVGLVLFAANESFREKIVRWWQQRCGDKGVFRKIHDAHFAQALAMGLRSGMPIEEAVSLAGQILKEVPGADERCRTCMEGLARGEGLA